MSERAIEAAAERDAAQMRIETLESALRYAANQLENLAGMLPHFSENVTPEVARLRRIAGDRPPTDWIKVAAERRAALRALGE